MFPLGGVCGVSSWSRRDLLGSTSLCLSYRHTLYLSGVHNRYWHTYCLLQQNSVGNVPTRYLSGDPNRACQGEDRTCRRHLIHYGIFPPLLRRLEVWGTGIEEERLVKANHEILGVDKRRKTSILSNIQIEDYLNPKPLALSDIDSLGKASKAR